MKKLIFLLFPIVAMGQTFDFECCPNEYEITSWSHNGHRIINIRNEQFINCLNVGDTILLLNNQYTIQTINYHFGYIEIHLPVD